MAKLGELTLAGASGNTYTFEVFPYDTTFNALPAVYYISRRNENQDGTFSHSRIYVGQTSNLAERFIAHHDEECFESHRANCKSVLISNSEKERLAIEADLVAGLNPPCNG